MITFDVIKPAQENDQNPSHSTEKKEPSPTSTDLSPEVPANVEQPKNSTTQASPRPTRNMHPPVWLKDYKTYKEGDVIYVFYVYSFCVDRMTTIIHMLFMFSPVCMLLVWLVYILHLMIIKSLCV